MFKVIVKGQKPNGKSETRTFDNIKFDNVETLDNTYVAGLANSYVNLTTLTNATCQKAKFEDVELGGS